jgi:DNA-binding transcriptional MerR regulator/DNA gyrase inhibitor GyrI
LSLAIAVASSVTISKEISERSKELEKSITIHKLAAQLGLTSRTLRHWEAEGLFLSGRDRESGWRVYDENAVMRIRMTALLRKLDIPISDIKTVTNISSFEILREIIIKRLSSISAQKLEYAAKEDQLTRVLSFLKAQHGDLTTETHFSSLSAFVEANGKTDEEEEDSMNPGCNDNGKGLRFVTLPPMRAVYNTAIGVSPEDFAMNPIMEWLDSEHLNGTARMFGGNVPPLPKGDETPYGYGFCASIPDSIAISGHLKEMQLPGGVYAMLESTDDISASWEELMELLSVNEKYMPDRQRLCLEEHIRNDGSGFHITLLEPVKEKK